VDGEGRSEGCRLFAFADREQARTMMFPKKEDITKEILPCMYTIGKTIKRKRARVSGSLV